MDNLIKAEDLYAEISVLNKEEIIEILQSEGINITGTLRTLRTRLRDFVNERREPNKRMNIDFPVIETEDKETESENENLPIFPPVPQSIPQQSFDDEVMRLFNINVQTNPLSRSTVQFTTRPLNETLIYQTSQTTANLNTATSVTVSSQTIPSISVGQPISPQVTLPLPTLPQISVTQVPPLESQLNQSNIMANNLNPNATQFNPHFYPHNTMLNQQNSENLVTANWNNNVPNLNIGQLFNQFMQFLQISNPTNIPFSQMRSETFQTRPPENISQTNYQLPQGFQPNLLPTTNNAQFSTNPLPVPPGFCLPQASFIPQVPSFLQPQNSEIISPKRILYISTALEKRKIFFSGKPGNDPNRFIDYLKECQTTMGITDLEIYNSLPVILHGEALNWFRLNKENFPTLDLFYKALIRQYCVKNFQDRLMHEAYARQQAKNESITSFVTNIRLIFKQMNPPLSLERQIDIACGNLNPNYIPHVRRSQITSFDQLIDEGKEIELNVEKIRNYKGPPNPSTTVVKSAAWPKKPEKQESGTKKPNSSNEIAATKETKPKNKNPEKQETKQKNYDTAIKKSPSGSKLENMPNRGECFKCRQEGHIFKDCPNSAVYKYFCYSCGKGNVTVVKCPNCKDKKKENQ